MPLSLIILSRRINVNSNRNSLRSRKMAWSFAFLICISLIVIDALQNTEPRGIQLRLTRRGLDYTINDAVKILKEDLVKKKIDDFSGSDSGFHFAARNLQLKRFDVGSSSLRPNYRKGLTASMSSVTVVLSGEFKYEKRVWGIRIRDTVNINAEASDVSFSLSLNFGRSTTGHPTVAVNWCNANVNRLRLHFSGSKASWLYNLFDSMIERQLKGKLSDLMCKASRDSINKHAREQMAEFEIRKAIDKWATLDYSLSAPPLFDHEFMDVFIKGEFVERKKPFHHTSLKVPAFQAISDNSKMLYFWLTDFTANTAGEVYHKAGVLALNITQKSKVPWTIRTYLNTKGMGILIPQLARRFPNRPLQIHFHSYKAPKIVFNEGQVRMLIFAAADFKVVLKNGTLVNVFTMNMDVTGSISPMMTAVKLTGELKDFKLSLNISKSEVGKISLPKRLPLIQSLVQAGILKGVKVALIRGIPLPKLKEVSFTNSNIKIFSGVIRIATDCVYTRKK